MKKIPAYLQTSEFSTVWNLAHNMARVSPESAEENNLPEEVRHNIFSILSAITWHKISVRTPGRLILDDDSLLTFLIDFRHTQKITRTLRHGTIDKEYLDGLYVKRPEVIAWCEKDYIPIPPKWANSKPGLQSAPDSIEDEMDIGWYDQLTDQRKKRVTCLEIAKQLWKDNPEQSYEDVYKHPTMIKFGTPGVFSFEAFKKWARRYASDYATSGGRRTKIKQL
jgi:hypothetical protein